MVQAMASGCLVLGSDTEPVREVITHGKNGLLADFYDVDELVVQAVMALDDPESRQRLRDAARQTVLERYDKNVCLPKLVQFFEEK
jgi:glycosyltransferase involved in cell wall biosynthesis